jgi:hypothetical protein
LHGHGHGHGEGEHHHSDKETSVDPFQDFGPGVISYFRMIKAMILLFGILSLLIAPVGILYMQGDGYDLDSSTEA